MDAGIEHMSGGSAVAEAQDWCDTCSRGRGGPCGRLAFHTSTNGPVTAQREGGHRLAHEGLGGRRGSPCIVCVADRGSKVPH